jgi:hypothetical protein
VTEAGEVQSVEPVPSFLVNDGILKDPKDRPRPSVISLKQLLKDIEYVGKEMLYQF